MAGGQHPRCRGWPPRPWGLVQGRGVGCVRPGPRSTDAVAASPRGCHASDRGDFEEGEEM